MYIHPIKTTANPNKGGTQYVVTQVSNSVTPSPHENDNGVSYISTPNMEWYESKNGPRAAPQSVINSENYIDLVGFDCIVSMMSFIGDLVDSLSLSSFDELIHVALTLALRGGGGEVLCENRVQPTPTAHLVQGCSDFRLISNLPENPWVRSTSAAKLQIVSKSSVLIWIISRIHNREMREEKVWYCSIVSYWCRWYNTLPDF